jgi:hypothetical protein
MYLHMSNVHGAKQGRDVSRERNECHVLSFIRAAIIANSAVPSEAEPTQGRVALSGSIVPSQETLNSV